MLASPDWGTDFDRRKKRTWMAAPSVPPIGLRKRSPRTSAAVSPGWIRRTWPSSASRSATLSRSLQRRRPWLASCRRMSSCAANARFRSTASRAPTPAPALASQVKVRLTAAKTARTIVLAPTDAPARAARGLEGRYLTRLLDGLPMVPGDRVRVNPFGTQTRNFVVTKAAPPGPVIVAPSTVITCEGGTRVAVEKRSPMRISADCTRRCAASARLSSFPSSIRRCSRISALRRPRASCSTDRRAPARP